VGYQLPILAEHEPRPSKMHRISIKSKTSCFISFPTWRSTRIPVIKLEIAGIKGKTLVKRREQLILGVFFSWLHSMIPQDLADLPNRGC